MNKHTTITLAIAGLALACVSCSSEQAAALRHTLVQVVGPNKVNFGRVKGGAGNIHASFRLRNSSERIVKIADVRRSCTCMSYKVDNEAIAPGGESRVTVELETSKVAGKRDGRALVVFDDPAADPITLHFEAFVEMPYTVTITPTSWAIPPTVAAGESLVRTFVVTEFSGDEVDESAKTSIFPASDDVSVVDVAPWEVRGWRPPGFARRARVTLELKLPAEEFVGDVIKSLRFQRLGAGDEDALETEVQILVQKL